MQTATNINDLRAALLKFREAGETVAFVPTMGALHQGHMALVAAAKSCAKRVVVSIFVNPLQFAPTEDLATYPRQPDADKKLLAEGGCDLLYMPDAAEMYPEGFATEINPGPMAKLLEGAFRPHFFFGVATVVAKLLLQVLPDVAFFGEKDYQQLLVIRRVVKDLNLPIHIAGVPTVRDADGLALSSRNAYLSSDERQRALALPQSLAQAAQSIRGGHDIETALKAGKKQLEDAGFKLDYFELADAKTLEPLRQLTGTGRLLAAARMGKTRLIDNVPVDIQ